MAPVEPAAGQVGVEVAYCAAPHQLDLTPLQLPAGSSVLDALQASGVLQRHGLALDGVSVGLWGRACSLDVRLRERDRVEIYRPLQVDPKEARRVRYRQHRERYGAK